MNWLINNRVELMNYFKLSLAFCISLLLLSCNNQKQNKELSAERRLLDTFFMQAHYDNNDYPDETITLNPKDTNSNEYIERTFYVDVGVTDISDDLKDTTLSKEYIRRLFELNNIRNISCYMLYNLGCGDFNQFPTNRELGKNNIDLREISPFKNVLIGRNSDTTSFYSYYSLDLDIDASLKNYDYQSKHFSSIKPVYCKPIINCPKNDTNAIVVLNPNETEGKFNEITPRKDTRRFVVKFHIPKVYSNNLIRVQSMTNPLISLINSKPIVSETIIVDGKEFPKNIVFSYLNNVFLELSKFQIPDFKKVKNDQNIVKNYFQYEKNYKERIYNLLSAKNINEATIRKIIMYWNLSRIYLLSEHPRLRVILNGGSACQFNIRIAERR